MDETMLVKRYILVTVLATVMWSTLGGALSRPSRAVSSGHGRVMRKREYPTPYQPTPPKYPTPEPTTTTTPPTSTDSGSCFYNKQWYKNGEYLEQTPCSFTVCLDGGVAIGDIFCETIDGCNLNWKPDECCPPCQTDSTTAPMETTPTPGVTHK